MRLEILQVPDCPNVAVLQRRLEQVLAGQTTEVELVQRVIDDHQDATAAGMVGSPTLLVDGRDPFAVAGQPPSLSCRLFRDNQGGVAGAPSVVALRDALGLTAPAGDDADRTAGACCARVAGADSAAASLGSARFRAAPSDPAERAVHRCILRVFAKHGAPPSMLELVSAASPFASPVEEIVARLHASDVIRLGASGFIEVAYPFSALPTRHRIRLAHGGEAYSMCAVDALGIAFMLDTDTVIETSDPVNGTPITVTVERGEPTGKPSSAVVFVGIRSGTGPTAETCCDYLNFFTDRPSAQAWAELNPQVTGGILDLSEATRLGQTIFGGLLNS
jgi:Alkylmercury lyase